jgi:hypothetical protein
VNRRIINMVNITTKGLWMPIKLPNGRKSLFMNFRTRNEDKDIEVFIGSLQELVDLSVAYGPVTVRMELVSREDWLPRPTLVVGEWEE